MKLNWKQRGKKTKSNISIINADNELIITITVINKMLPLIVTYINRAANPRPTEIRFEVNNTQMIMRCLDWKLLTFLGSSPHLFGVVMAGCVCNKWNSNVKCFSKQCSCCFLFSPYFWRFFCLCYCMLAVILSATLNKRNFV